MKLLHIIANENDKTRVERVMRYMPDKFEHKYVMPSEIESVEADLIHAHSWFVCGQTTCQYALAKNIPYIVDVVQSDLQQFRKSLFGKQTAERVLSEAARVVFTSQAQENFLAQHLPSKVADTVFAKSTLFYEPLDTFWFDNQHIHPPTALVHIKLLYVGPLTEESRIEMALHAMKKLQRHNYPVTLTAVEVADGNNTDQRFRKKMLSEAEANASFRMSNAGTDEQLREIYRNHDILLLPNADSTRLFAEALTQGVPVIYARDSIADGIFKEGLAGYAVNFKSTDELARTILTVSESFGTIEQHIIRLQPFSEFDGREQARHYEHLYENVLTRK